MVVPYRMSTNISIEHFLITFLSLNALMLEDDSQQPEIEGKSSCTILYAFCLPNICLKFVFSAECTWRSKLKMSHLITISETDLWQCLCTSLSVISGYAITGATPHWICEAGELTQPPSPSHHPLPQCRIYALVNWFRKTGIGSSNGWPPVRHQAITQSHPDLLSIAPWGINFSEIRIKNVSFLKM